VTTGTVRELHTGETLAAHRAMAELRPAFAGAADRFAAQVDEGQRPQGYRLFASFVAGEPDAVAVAGFRRVTALSWGDVLYLDDLSTRADHRGRGHGGALLAAVVTEAEQLGCEAVHLDSGHQRFAAHRLYLGAGFEIRSHHLVRPLR
jgi:GNAT superfamily N-acetyltransferase